MEEARAMFSDYEVELIQIGSTNDSEIMIINNVVKLKVKDVKEAWSNGLREKL